MALIDEFNKGAIEEGFESWADPAIISTDRNRIRNNIRRNKGKYITAMSVAERAKSSIRNPIPFEALKYLRPHLLNDKGELNQEKWDKLAPSERSEIKGQITDKFENFKKTGFLLY